MTTPVTKEAAGANNPRRTLKLITKTHRVVDIYAADRQRIANTDWARVHIEGDRRPAVDIPDRRKWSWRK